MPVRKPSTERQRRLGAELRRMREHIGMTINEAATVHRTDRTTVSNTDRVRSASARPLPGAQRRTAPPGPASAGRRADTGRGAPRLHVEPEPQRTNFP